MKEGWEYKCLGDVAKIYLGLTHTPKYQDSGIPFISVKDISNGDLDFKDTKFISKEEFENMPNGAKPQKGDILFCRVGTIGKPQILRTDVPFGIFVSVGFLRITNKSLPEYVKYWMESPLFYKQVRDNVQGSTIKNLNTGWLKKFIVPIPSLSEQQSIVDYLDSAFAKIDAMKVNAEKALNEAKALFQASLKEMLEPKEGWEEKKLKETAKYRRGSFPQPYGNKEWYDGEGSMPFVQVAELQEDSFKLVPITKRLISKIAQPLSVFVPAGTVLVTLQGSIGKVAITDYDSYVDRTIAIFQDYKIAVDKTFFAYQLKIRFEIERLKARGTTIKTITKEEFANFIINCPPLSEQQSIVETLDSLKSKVDRLQENYDKISQECDALKQAILRQVFE
jgi:type I restriction enzyme S subunit